MQQALRSTARLVELALPGFLVLAGCVAPDASAAGGPGSIAIENVTVVDTRAGELHPGQTVIVSGERIELVGRAGDVRVPPGARRIDGSGRYLMPGLWDMHVHMTQAARFGELDIANGVTGVRDMFTVGAIDALKDSFLSGRSVGPRVVAAGRIVDGEEPFWPFSIEAKDADAGRAAVAQVRADGADFVKVYSKLSRDAYFAIAAEARRVGLPFAGHVPYAVMAAEASDAGQHSIEHLTGVLLGCSSREDELMRADRFSVEAADAVRASYDPMRATALFEKLRNNRTWQCPTLVVLRSIAHLDDPAVTQDERLGYLPAPWATQWDPANDWRFKGYTDADWASAREGYARSLDLVRAMHAAGVPFLAGTDCANPYVFPGFSLHDELALLVETGFTPVEALRTATWNPAVFLGREVELGSVEPKKLADLVLLDADPLADVGNASRIAAVIANGRLFDRAALDALLATKR